jgi:hypothetical protein
MKSKLSLCFGGQLRCHKKIIVFWKEYFIKPLIESGFEVVIFFHTSNEYDDNLIQEIREDYNGITCFFEKTNDLDYKGIKPKIFKLIPSGLTRNGHNQLLREFNHMDSVIKMKKKYENNNNLIFDYVVRVRPDVFPMSYFDVNSMLQNDNCFYISNHDHHGGLNARFTISKSNISDYIYTILDDCEKVEVPSNLFSGEQFWMYFLKYKGFENNFINYNLYHIRDYDDKFPKNEQGNIYCNGRVIFKFIPNEILTVKLFNK